jgi:hypothetical protein
MAEEEDEDSHPVIQAIDKFFAEQEVEKWRIRRPLDLKEDDEEDSKKPLSKKIKVDAADATSTVTGVPSLSSESWVQIASFLDPHDIDSLAVSWKTPYSALKYPARATAATSTTVTSTPETLPALRVRLESVFRYFSILKMHADQLQKLGYKWVDIIKLFTGVAKYMQHKYGATYEVHPIHRALVAEGILVRLCNHAIGTLLPILHGYNNRNSGDAEATKVSLNRVPVPATTDPPMSNLLQRNTIYGDEWVISLGDPSQLRNTEDPENFINTWLVNAKEKHLNDPKVKYTFAERKAILEHRCPVVWLFDYPGDSNGYEVGIMVDDSNNTTFHNWSPYYGEYGQAPRFWQKGGPEMVENLKSVAHYVLLYPGVSMGGETLGPGQRLFRLAWLQAHGFPHNIIEDWESAIATIQEEDDEDNGPCIEVDVIRANVKAMMVAKESKFGLAKSGDYSLE